MAELENINPNVYKKTEERAVLKSELNENEVDPIDEREVFGESRRRLFYKRYKDYFFRFDKKH